MALKTTKIKVRQPNGTYKTITTTYDDSDENVVKKIGQQETGTVKVSNTSTISNSNLVGGVSINNASMMEKSRLRRSEAPKNSLLDSLSSKKNTSNWYDSMLEKKNKATNSEGYTNTGKTYGDYYYQNYSEYKNTPIYKKDNKYYMYLDNKYQPLGKIKKNADNTITTYGYDGSNYLTEKQQTDLANGISVMTSAKTKKEKLSKEDKKALLEAKKQGYKEPEGTKTKDYQKAESKFKKLQKEYNLSDEELQEYINTGKLSYKGLKTNLVTKSMTNAKSDADFYRKQIANSKIEKYEKNSNELTPEQRLDVETAWMNNENLTKKEKQQRLQKAVDKNIKDNKIEKEALYQVGQGYLNRPLKENQSPLEKILYGTADVSANLVHGIGDFVEDVGDAATYGISDVASRLGAKKFAKAAREQAQQEDTNTLFEPFETKVSKGSVLGQKSKSAVQSIGHTLPIMAAGASVKGLTGNPKAVVGATSAMTFTSSFGDAKTRALNSGASNKEATQYAFVQATAETISEQIFDGIPGAKSAGWADNLVERMGSSVSNYLGTRAGKIFEKTLNVSGEGFEEIISNMLSAMGKDIVHYIDKDYKYDMEGQTGKILTDVLSAASSQDSRDAFVSALLTSAILNGGQAVLSTQTRNTILDAYAQDNNITKEEAKKTLLDEDGNINYEKTKEQINNNKIDTPQEVQQEVKEEVQGKIQEQPKTQPTISERKIDEIIKNVTKDSKINYTQEEIADLKKTLYNEVEKLGGKVEEIKQQQNKQEQKTPVKDAMNKQKSVIENAKSFSEQVDDALKNKYPKRDMLVVSKNTPKILQDIGLSDLPITLTQKHLYTMTHEKGKYKDVNYHNIDIETIKQIPEALSRPLNVLKSDTKDNSIVVVTELSDNNNDIIVASIKLDGKGTIQDIRINSNVMTSAYGKSQNYDYFMQDNIRRGNLLYDIDKGIIKRISSSTNSLSKLDAKDRLQLSMRSSNGNNSISDIPKNDSPISTNNDTTKTNKSQIIPSKHSMQQNEKNTQKETTKTKEKNNKQDKHKEKNTIDEKKEKNTIEERIPDVIEVKQVPMDKTSLNKLSKNMAKELYLNNSQITDLKDVIQDFTTRDFNEYRKSDLFNSIKDKFSEHNEKIIADDSLNDIQYQIKNTKIKVPEYIKEGIGDYNNLRQSNFGKTKLGNTGIELDSFYDELASDYPSYFDPELSGEDQLLRIIDIANMDNSYTEKYTLDDDYIKDITEYIDESIKDYKNETARKLAEKDIKEKYKQDKITYALPKKITHKEVRQQLLNEMGITDKDLSVGKDIASLRGYQLTDPIRVNEKVFGAEMGKLINEATIEKTKHNTAEKTRFLNRERNDIKDLGIKARSKESAAVQKYAEKQYVNKYGETVPYGDKELMSEFKNTKTQEKIKKAASMLRNKYDRYIDEINDVITALGYDPIPKRKDYMKHFQELGDVFSQTGVPFNLNDMKAEDLPTDINGLTEFNKPGKNWFASAQQRYGNKTTYDAITGIDTYLEGAANLIYHTADIQRYRALSQLVRDTFGQKKGFENLDNLTNEEAQQRIKDIQNNKLSKYAAWLDEQANNLAGKKGAIDRGVERFFGRRVYTGLNTIKKQVGSNMTGFNVRSAMTNFISSTIASAKTNKLAFVKGTISTINNMFKNDGFVNKSDFLTSRFGSDMLSAKTWQKVSNAGQIFMTGSDWFTSNQIVRSKYYEGLQKGMTEKQAIDYADDFASRVMGDRSQGMTAEAFNSKTLGLLTQFQLETNNQWQYMIHDSIMDYQRGSKINGGLKAGATILFQLGQLAAFSYLFNELFQKLTGSRAAFDPIDILKKLFGADDDDDKPFGEKIVEAAKELTDSIPFGNLFTEGGRLPISEALPVKKLLWGKDNNGYKKSRIDTLKETVPYYVLPTGYGQAKKTVKGLSMFTNDKEIKGSYTKSGRLRFPVEDTPENKIQAALFGQYASENARKYVNEGHNTLTEKQQKELKTLDIPISEYWEIKSGLSKITNELKGSNKTTDERKEIYYKYIDSLDIGKDQKNILKKLQYKSYTESDKNIKDYISSINAKKSTKQDLLKRMGLDK